MGEFFQRIRGWFSRVGKRIAAFYNANRLLVLGGLTVLSILLIVWARLGFTFQPSQFFAGQVGQLSVQCGTTQNVLTWTADSRANSNGVQRGNNGTKNLPNCENYWCWLPTTNFAHQVPTATAPATYTDTQLQSGVCYEYRVKYSPDLASNSVFCPTNCNIPVTSTPTATPTPTLTPTLTATPTATPTPTSTPAATPTPTPSPTATPTPTPTATPTPTPTSSPMLTLATAGRNVSTGSVQSSTVSATSNQQIEIAAVVSNPQSVGALTGVNLTAGLPAGLVYRSGSTTVNGATVATDTIIGGGLDLGTLAPGQAVTVTFQATVQGTAFPVGQSQTVVTVRATADGVTPQISQVTVIVNRAAGQVGKVQTGPGDAVWAALLVSVVMTLLYVSYAHTSVFRRREAASLGAQHDPMDFRS